MFVYNVITVKELCSLADIQRSTFYCHYSLPHDILAEIEDEIISEIKNSLPNASKYSRRYTFVLYEKSFEVLYSHPDLTWLFLGKNTDKNFSLKFAGLLHETLITEWNTLYWIQNKAIIGYAFEFFAAGTLGIPYKQQILTPYLQNLKKYSYIGKTCGLLKKSAAGSPIF